MISESYYWKDDLLRQAEILRVIRRKRRLGERSLAKVERSLLLGFYSIRKLTEADKLSYATIDQKLAITSYSWLGKNITKMNLHRIDELYDLENGRSMELPLRVICNQLIHSYVFSFLFDASRRLDGIFVTSEQNRRKNLLLLPLDRAVELFETVGRDYPNNSITVFDPETSDYKTKSIMLVG
jgi:hypothetical protein